MVRIFLMGYMGSGKTTLGRALARELKLSFVDLDWYIEERRHKTIAELFALYGEDQFREIERQMLHEVADFENVVISTGGGTPCFFDNMSYMQNCGETLFLDVSPEILFKRLRVAKHQRPSLRGKSDDELKQIIADGLERRLPIYRKAKWTCDGGRLESVKQIALTVESVRTMLGI